MAIRTCKSFRCGDVISDVAAPNTRVVWVSAIGAKAPLALPVDVVELRATRQNYAASPDHELDAP